MAAPSLRAVGAGNAYSGTNSTLAKPAGVVEGDLLLAILCADGANDPIPWATRIPAGWLIAEEDLATGGAFKTHGAVAYKVAGASEPSNYAFSFGVQSGTGIVVAYQGVNTTTPINVSAKQENGSATTAHPLPSITTTVGDCLAVAVYQHRSNNGVPYTEPSGWAERVDFKGTTSNSNFGVADKVFASAGATGTTSATGNAADETWVAVIALAPNGGGGPTADFTITAADATFSGGAVVRPMASFAITASNSVFSGGAGPMSAASFAAVTSDSQFAGGATGDLSVGTITCPALKNNTGTVLANEAGITVFVYSVATGAHVVTKTGQTTNPSGVMAFTAAGIVPGTTYRVVIVLGSGAEGMDKVAAT